MKTWKQILALVLAAVLCVGLLAACSPKTPAATDDAPATTDTPDVQQPDTPDTEPEEPDEDRAYEEARDCSRFGEW